MNGAYLGPDYNQDYCEQRLVAAGTHFRTLEDKTLFTEFAEAPEHGKAVGWFRGRMEFGPRAPGEHSMLANPRPTTMKNKIEFKNKV